MLKYVQNESLDEIKESEATGACFPINTMY